MHLGHAVLKHKRTILSGRVVLYFCWSVCLSVGPLVTSKYCEKMADSIEMHSGVVSWVSL